MAYTLPDLPYAFDALEPHIDAQTMEIHHDKHHAAYVNNVNAALASSELADLPIEELLYSLDRVPDDKRNAVRNNGGGHYNHSLFWKSLSGSGGGEPSGALSDAIDAAFGSFADFQAKLKAAGIGQFGSGWAWLGHDRSRQAPAARRRRLGARLLPALPEPPAGLHRRVVERRRLGRGRAALRRRRLKPPSRPAVRLGACAEAGSAHAPTPRGVHAPPCTASVLRPAEAPTVHGGLLLVEHRPRRLGLQRRHPLGRHRVGVHVGGQPDARLGGALLVAHDRLAGRVVAVDLGEQLIDQALGRHLLRAVP